jgi:uncharacterized protein YeaO (DUF488 family)
MTSEQFDEWMRELRSGKYTKIRGAMGHDNTCCALGVYLNHCGHYNDYAKRYRELESNYEAWKKIANKNDNTDLTLPELADHIESNHRTDFVKD